MQRLPVSVLQSHYFDTCVIETVGMRLVSSEQNGFSAGQDLRPAMCPLAIGAVELRNRRWRASRSRDLHQATNAVRSFDNRSVLGPSAAPWVNPGIAQHHRSATFGGDLFELVVREETDPTAIGGEERLAGALGPRQ